MPEGSLEILLVPESEGKVEAGVVTRARLRSEAKGTKQQIYISNVRAMTMTAYILPNQEDLRQMIQ